MVKALIYLCCDREGIQDHVCSMLQGWEVKVYASMNDVFDHLWENGENLNLVISEPATLFHEELFNAAENWPGLLFITVLHEFDHSEQIPENVVFLRREDLRGEILSQIDHWGKKRGFLCLDQSPMN